MHQRHILQEREHQADATLPFMSQPLISFSITSTTFHLSRRQSQRCIQVKEGEIDSSFQYDWKHHCGQFLEKSNCLSPPSRQHNAHPSHIQDTLIPPLNSPKTSFHQHIKVRCKTQILSSKSDPGILDAQVSSLGGQLLQYCPYLSEDKLPILHTANIHWRDRCRMLLVRKEVVGRHTAGTCTEQF